MKIKALCALVLLLFGASLASAQTITLCGGLASALYVNWPTFGFDVCHTGYNAYENRLDASNVQNLVLAWKYTLPDSSFPYSPAVVNVAKRLFRNDNRTTDICAECHNRHTHLELFHWFLHNSPGGRQWRGLYRVRYECVGPESGFGRTAMEGASGQKYPIKSPTVVDGVLYIGAQALGLGYNVSALNASTGAPLWTQAVDGTPDSPALVNGVVYIGGGSTLYALNAVTGALLCSSKSDQGVFPAVLALRIPHGVAYVGGGAVSALNALTGSLIWRYEPEDPFIFGTSSPAIANGVIYIVADLQYKDDPTPFSQLLALNASTGELVWSSPIGEASTLSPSVANGVVYVSVGGGGFAMFNAATGALLAHTQGRGWVRRFAACRQRRRVYGVLATARTSELSVPSICQTSDSRDIW